jgi:hypothetical protein
MCYFKSKSAKKHTNHSNITEAQTSPSRSGKAPSQESISKRNAEEPSHSTEEGNAKSRTDSSVEINFQHLDDEYLNKKESKGEKSTGSSSTDLSQDESMPECTSEFCFGSEFEAIRLQEKGIDQENHNFSNIMTHKSGFTTPEVPKPEMTCDCPNMLICDDDKFQHLFYKKFFERNVDYTGLGISVEDFKIQYFISGDELLSKYLELKSCKCSKLSVVITDYSMGVNVMSGVETAVALRKAGFNETLILRTSEIKQDLIQANPNFNELLSNGIINSYSLKCCFISLKEKVNSCLRNKLAGEPKSNL